MSTIIEAGGLLRRMLRGILILAAFFCAILAFRAGLAYFRDESGTVLAIGLTSALASSLPEGVTIENWGSTIAVLNGNDRPVVHWLYDHGAVLVLPGRDGSCMALRSKPAKKEPDA